MLCAGLQDAVAVVRHADANEPQGIVLGQRIDRELPGPPLKPELVHHRHLATKEQAPLRITGYIETFYYLSG